MFTRERLSRWTAALRANPEQQHTGFLANLDYTKFCCLGKLCEVEGIERDKNGMYANKTAPVSGFLPVELSADFGEPTGNFSILCMPLLLHDGFGYRAATVANDNGVPWPVIADHFDKYYPCSDEVNLNN